MAKNLLELLEEIKAAKASEEGKQETKERSQKKIPEHEDSEDSAEDSAEDSTEDSDKKKDSEEDEISESKVTIEIDWGSEVKNLDKEMSKEYGIKIVDDGKSSAKVTGDAKKVKKFLLSADYGMELEDLEDIFPELSESVEHKWTKESIIEFLNGLDADEIDEIGEYIMDSLMYNDELDEFDDFEDEDYEDDLDEAKFFQKKKVEIDREKRKNVSLRKKNARIMAKYYKKNKNRIKLKQKKYRKKAVQNPNKVHHHKGVSF